jgi:purine-binding chemotaxis protein CheW
VSEIESGKRKDDSVSRWVCFGVGDQIYGLPILAVQEVLRDTDIEPVPGASQQVLGVLNLRGNVVTVLDLRVRLGLPPAPADGDSRIVIVEHSGESFGLLVDRVADVRKIVDAAIKHAPDIGAAHSAVRVHGVYTRDGGMLTLLDKDSLVGDLRFVA